MPKIISDIPTVNERNTIKNHENNVQDVLENLDINTWVIPDDMQNLPTHIFKANLLFQMSHSTILRTEPIIEIFLLNLYYGQKVVIQYVSFL